MGIDELVNTEEQFDDTRTLSCNDNNREEKEGAKGIHVPGEGECTPVDNFEALLDDHGVDGGDSRAGDAEKDTEEGDGGTIEEDSNEEAQGDNTASREDLERRAREKDHE